jgi:hypothetical protein
LREAFARARNAVEAAPFRARKLACAGPRRFAVPAAAVDCAASTRVHGSLTKPRSCCFSFTTKGYDMTNKPTLIAYSVKDRGQGRKAKSVWVRIGGAWPFESGAPGYTIQLDALPLDGRIVLAEPKAEVDPADAVPELANS